MLACLALKYRYHEKNFCREVREPKGCRKAVGKTNTHTKKKKNTQRSSTFIWYFSHTTHSVADLPISPGKNQVRIIASMAVGRKLQ